MGIYWGQVPKPLRSHFKRTAWQLDCSAGAVMRCQIIAGKKKAPYLGAVVSGGGDYWLIDPRPIISAIVTIPPIMAINHAY